jgi:hypothetical protein
MWLVSLAKIYKLFWLNCCPVQLRTYRNCVNGLTPNPYNEVPGAYRLQLSAGSVGEAGTNSRNPKTTSRNGVPLDSCLLEAVAACAVYFVHIISISMSSVRSTKLDEPSGII